MAYLQNLNEAGVALQGYDPISYFSNQPIKGDAKISTSYEGATYYFNSEGHKLIFDEAPQRYAPQYGGFCAVAVSEGKTFPVDPNVYSVENDRLYLFYNGKLGNTKPQWDADADMRRANADEHWKNRDLAVVYPTGEY